VVRTCPKNPSILDEELYETIMVFVFGPKLLYFRRFQDVFHFFPLTEAIAPHCYYDQMENISQEGKRHF